MHQLMLGVPRTLCIVIWTFCIALSLPLHSWYAIPLCVFIHVVSARAAKKDPQFWDVTRRLLQYKRYYRV
jgi:type IV secretion system protein VirB3